MRALCGYYIGANLTCRVACSVRHARLREIPRGQTLLRRYNDVSVLENHHAAVTYRILYQPERDILSQLSSDQKQTVRKTIVKTILSTDMSRHFELHAKIKSHESAVHHSPAPRRC